MRTDTPTARRSGRPPKYVPRSRNQELTVERRALRETNMLLLHETFFSRL
jgi:hypothetical protein